MKQHLSYKGYMAKVVFDAEARVLRGKVDGIVDGVRFESASVEAVEAAFHEAVDRYLAECAAAGRRPAKPYKGQFNVRIEPALHRALADLAAERGVTLNHLVSEALRVYVAEH